jgi:hypothetical protein
MYCKRKDSTGPVFLYTGAKTSSPLFERCEADGSPLGAVPPTATAKAAQSRKKAPAPVTESVVVEEYASGDVV